MKKNIAKPANKKRPAVNVSKKAPLSSKASLPIQAPLPPKAPVPSEKPLPPKKVRSNVSSPKKVISKKSKYRVDFTNVTDLVTVSDCVSFVLDCIGYVEFILIWTFFMHSGSSCLNN